MVSGRGQAQFYLEGAEVYLVLQSFAGRLAGHSVKWFSDNQGVVHIVSRGSRKLHLQDGAMAIFELCFQHGIYKWIGSLVV